MNKKNIFSTFTSLGLNLCLFFCFLHLSSCQNDPKPTSVDNKPVQTMEQPTTTLSKEPTSTTPTTGNEQVSYSQALQTIIDQPSKGVLRGLDFTMNKEAVKGKEQKANFVNEQQDGSLLYDIDLNENEFVDLNYIFDKDQALMRIKTDIYSKDNATARQMYQTFEQYFNDTYETVNKTTWKGNGLSTHLRLLNNTKDHGVIVEWRKK